MNKTEFLAALERALSGLPEQDVQERLAFYGELIDDRVEEGLSEEEAVKERGSVDEIAKQTKAKRDTIVLNSIESVYGSGKSKGYAKIYATKEDAQAIEPEYILKRNGMQKPEYVAPEAPSE